MLLKIKPKLSARPLGSAAESDVGSRYLTTRTQRYVLRHFRAPAKADSVLFCRDLGFILVAFWEISSFLSAHPSPSPQGSNTCSSGGCTVLLEPRFPKYGRRVLHSHLAATQSELASSDRHHVLQVQQSVCFTTQSHYSPSGPTIYLQSPLKMWYCHTQENTGISIVALRRP